MAGSGIAGIDGGVDLGGVGSAGGYDDNMAVGQGMLDFGSNPMGAASQTMANVLGQDEDDEIVDPTLNEGDVDNSADADNEVNDDPDVDVDDAVNDETDADGDVNDQGDVDDEVNPPENIDDSTVDGNASSDDGGDDAVATTTGDDPGDAVAATGDDSSSTSDGSGVAQIVNA